MKILTVFTLHNLKYVFYFKCLVYFCGRNSIEFRSHFFFLMCIQIPLFYYIAIFNRKISLFFSPCLGRLYLFRLVTGLVRLTCCPRWTLGYEC